MKISDFILDRISSDKGRQNLIEKMFSQNNLYRFMIQLPRPRKKKDAFTEALFSNEFGPDSGFIFAYCIEKHRERRVRSIEGSVNPWTITNNRAWFLTLYKFPLNNIRCFKQKSSHFEIGLMSDETIEHLSYQKRGFAQRDMTGYFTQTDPFIDMISKLKRKQRETIAKPFGFRSLDLTNIVIHFNTVTGSYAIFKQDGSTLTDEEMRIILN